MGCGASKKGVTATRVTELDNTSKKEPEVKESISAEQNQIVDHTRSFYDHYTYDPQEIGSGANGIVYVCHRVVKNKEGEAVPTKQLNPPTQLMPTNSLNSSSRSSDASTIDSRRNRKRKAYAAKLVLSGQNDKMLNDILAEVAIMKELGVNEHVVGLVDAFLDDSFCYIVMDLFADDLVHAMLAKKTDVVSAGQIGVLQLTRADVVNVIQQMLKSICYVHSLGIMHRDIKADNYLVTHQDLSDPECKIVLTDFGYAVKLEPGEYRADVVGTPKYFAPEVIEMKYEFRSDVWSMGVIVYALFTGSFPFSDKSEILDHDPDFRPIPRAARRFLVSLLMKDAEDRSSAASALKHPFLTSTNTSFNKNNSRDAMNKNNSKDAMNKNNSKDTMKKEKRSDSLTKFAKIEIPLRDNNRHKSLPPKDTKGDKFEPQKSSLSPQKSSLSPQKSSLSPQKSSLSPQKSSLSPQKSSLEPQKSSLEPQKSSFGAEKSSFGAEKSSFGAQKSSLTGEKSFSTKDSKRNRCSFLSTMSKQKSMPSDLSVNAPEKVSDTSMYSDETSVSGATGSSESDYSAEEQRSILATPQNNARMAARRGGVIALLGMSVLEESREKASEAVTRKRQALVRRLHDETETRIKVLGDIRIKGGSIGPGMPHYNSRKRFSIASSRLSGASSQMSTTSLRPVKRADSNNLMLNLDGVIPSSEHCPFEELDNLSPYVPSDSDRLAKRKTRNSIHFHELEKVAEIEKLVAKRTRTMPAEEFAEIEKFRGSLSSFAS